MKTNKQLLDEILSKPNKRNYLIGKYGVFQDLHKLCEAWFSNAPHVRDLYNYVLENYDNFKTAPKRR